MDTWDEFFTDEKELIRAKIEQLEGVLEVLPWIATIDKFQHWIYTNPTHSVAEREKAWLEILGAYGSGVVDYSEFMEARTNAWHKQLHIFEVPFYYIEYGIAQLGAIAIWKNYCDDPKAALEAYMNALKLGYTRSIHEIYETAGIRFDFSANYIRDLMEFVFGKLNEQIAAFEALETA